MNINWYYAILCLSIFMLKLTHSQCLNLKWFILTSYAVHHHLHLNSRFKVNVVSRLPQFPSDVFWNRTFALPAS